MPVVPSALVIRAKLALLSAPCDLGFANPFHGLVTKMDPGVDVGPK